MIIGSGLLLLQAKLNEYVLPNLVISSWLNNRFGDILMVIVMIGVTIGCFFAVPSPSYPKPQTFSVAMAIFLVPYFWKCFDNIFVIIPWLSVTVFGMLLGDVLKKDQEKGFKVILVSAIVMFPVFIFFRVFYVTGVFNFGNYRVLLEPLTYYSFFSMAKYPPSLTFITFWMSLDLSILFFSHKVLLQFREKFPLKQITVFGKVPLFFYFLHLLAFDIMAAPFKGTTLGGIYLEWVLGMYLFYLPCLLYNNFKQKTDKNSLWRLF